uniref:Uncharacterized protein n=1 Tax=Timema shepardi TaxID=629360 RepID=A0A7R9B5E8_TIMSH|nr:unnamed protein product [Timema shepardi]
MSKLGGETSYNPEPVEVPRVTSSVEVPRVTSSVEVPRVTSSVEVPRVTSPVEGQLHDGAHNSTNRNYVSILTICGEEVIQTASLQSPEYLWQQCLGGVLLLTTILNRMVTFEESLTEEMFEALKEQESRNCFNNFLKPSKLSRDLRLALLLQSYWTNVDKHTVCHMITCSSVPRDLRLALLLQSHWTNVDKHMITCSFVPRDLRLALLLQSHWTNVDKHTVCHMSTLMIGPFSVVGVPPAVPLSPEHCSLAPNGGSQMRVVRVPSGEIFSRIPSFNEGDSNSVITNYYQSGPGSIKNTCIVELLMVSTSLSASRICLALPCLAFTRVLLLHKILNFAPKQFRAETDDSVFGWHTNADYIDERIEEFLKTFPKFVETLPSEDLKEVRNSLIKLKESADLYLREEVTRNWHEIINQEYVFDRRTKEIKFLQEITLKELQTWLEDHLSNGNQTKFRKLSIQLLKWAASIGPKLPNGDLVEVSWSLSRLRLAMYYQPLSVRWVGNLTLPPPYKDITAQPSKEIGRSRAANMEAPCSSFVVGHVRPSDGVEEHMCVRTVELNTTSALAYYATEADVTTQGTARKYSFQFVTDTQTKSDQHFITDIDVFKSNVAIYPFTRIVS